MRRHDGTDVSGLHTGFISEQRLADLLFHRRVRRVGPGVVESDGEGFVLCEAVRVLGRTDGDSDPYGLTGVVESLYELMRAGATLTAEVMHLGSACYRIERGVIAMADGPSSNGRVHPSRDELLG
ncbi:MAG: hypothetical protein JRI68_16490 [Deltaproteobacteria bacterium]|nr:hypothetical protein [Deltaproteobacteria bacterium]